MVTDNREKILKAYREMGPAEWSLRCMRGLVSGFPLVGGLMAEGISLAIDDPTIQVTANDGLLAAGTFDPVGHKFIGHGLSSSADHGAGHYRFSFAQDLPNKEYLVYAQINNANYNITNQDEGGFEITVLDRTSETLVDRPIKFVVFSSAERRRLFVE